MKISIKTINVLSLGGLIALVFCPLFQLYLKLITFYPLLLIWIISASIIDNKKIALNGDGFSFIAYICVLFLAAFVLTQSSDYLRRVITVILISFSSIYMYSFYSRHYELVREYVWFVYGCLLIGLFTTIPGLIQNPMASRILATTGELYGESYYQYKRMGIGGYEYIYTLVIFVIFAPNVLSVFSGLKKRIVFAMHIGMIICIFLSGYTTAILFTITMTMISFIMSKKNRGLTTSIIVIVIASLLILVFMEPLLLLVAKLADQFNVYYVSTRINELLFAEEANDISSLERMQLYRNALINFIHSPLIGALNGHSMLKSGHSQILGYLETFGVFGLPYTTLMIKLFSKQAKQITVRSYRYVLNCCHLFYVFFALINNVDVAYPLVWSAFFVLPIISFIFEHNEIECK